MSEAMTDAELVAMLKREADNARGAATDELAMYIIEQVLMKVIEQLEARRDGGAT